MAKPCCQLAQDPDLSQTQGGFPISIYLLKQGENPGAGGLIHTFLSLELFLTPPPLSILRLHLLALSTSSWEVLGMSGARDEHIPPHS